MIILCQLHNENALFKRCANSQQFLPVLNHDSLLKLLTELDYRIGIYLKREPDASNSLKYAP